MDPAAHLDWLRRESAAFAAAARRGAEAPVAACPGWRVGELVVHLGVIHRRIEKNVRTAATEPVWAEPQWEVDPGRPDLVEWFEQGAAELVATLERHGPDAPAWHWFPGGTARVVYRRMAHETAVHRWDAEAAHGDPAPIDSGLAADGLDEMLDAMLPVAVWAGGPPPGSEPAGERFRFRSPDGAVDRTVAFGPGGIEHDRAAGGADLTLTGPTSDLLLFVWGRLPADRLALDGDAALVDRWAQLAPPV